MGGVIVDLAFIAGGVAVIIYRESVGNMLGDADWMKYVGGPYSLAIIIGIFAFFYGLADITGTTGLLFAPVRGLFSLGGSASAPPTELPEGF